MRVSSRLDHTLLLGATAREEGERRTWPLALLAKGNPFAGPSCGVVPCCATRSRRPRRSIIQNGVRIGVLCAPAGGDGEGEHALFATGPRRRTCAAPTLERHYLAAGQPERLAHLLLLEREDVNLDAGVVDQRKKAGGSTAGRR